MMDKQFSRRSSSVLSNSVLSAHSGTSSKSNSMASGGRRRKKGEVDVTMSTLLEPAQMLQSELSLHEAARKNSKEELLKLISAKVNVNSKNNLDRTALHWATANGHLDLLEPLINAGGDTEAEDKYGMRPILWAVWFGHEDVVKALVGAGVSTQCVNRQGMNLLHCAAHQNHAGLIQYTHDNLDSFPMNEIDKDERTALHLAASRGNTDAVDKLIEFKCNLSLKDKNGQSAVHLASEEGHDEVLRMLIQMNVEVNDRDIDGFTALHLAAVNGHKGAAEVLLAHGADSNAENVKEMTPLHVASLNGHPDMIDLLVEHGSKLDARNHQGNTPLHLAVISKHDESVRHLIRANCPLDICNYRKMTALHEAVDAGLDDITEMLLVASASLTLHDKMGKTPLAIASRGSFTSLVDMLIKAERYRKQARDEVHQPDILQCGVYHHCFYSASCNAFIPSRPPSVKRRRSSSSLQFKVPLHPNASQMKEILYRLAFKQLRPTEWKKLARYWLFTEDHIKALEHQYTGPTSYKEHGYRLLLIWLHGIQPDENPLKFLFEGIEAIGRRELAEEIRKKCNLQEEKNLAAQHSCVIS